MSTASARALALDIAERIEGLGTVGVRRFFGGAALVADGVQFAFVMKGSLYLRADEASKADLEAMGASPFSYAGAAKTVTVASYYEAPDEVLVDAGLLRDWAGRAHRAARAARDSGRGRAAARRRRA